MRLLLLMLSVAGCGGHSPPSREPTPPPPATTPARPATVTDDMVASSDHVVGTLTKLATDVDHAADCKAATAALRSNQDAIRAVQAEADRLEQQWSAASADAQAWFKTTYGQRMDDNNNRMLKKATACDADPEFKTAFHDLNAH